ncbi:MAG: hypothetical protein E7323_05995 [Clostridiales bacterium]|nr:hypothetical protein [Clostridiales bacterium]
MTKRMTPSEWLSLGALLLALLLSFAVVCSVSQNLFDSDTSSDLVYAHHLAHGGDFISRNWCYSTEIRVVATDLIFTPLFMLFDDWSVVRTIGTMLLQLILLASYYALTRACRMGRKAFFLGGALMLMPVSVTYGRIVLYHTYYMQYLILGLLMTAGLIKMLRCLEEGKKSAFWLHLFLFVLLTWLSSLSGYRQMAVTHVPLALMAVIWLWRAANRRDDLRALQTLLVIGAGVIAGCVGLLINAKLQEVASFSSFSEIGLTFIPADKLMNLLYGLLHLFGFRRGVNLLTITGILSVLGVVVAIFCLLHSCRAAISKERQPTLARQAVNDLLPCSLAVLCLLMFLTEENTEPERYLLPYAFWYIPLLAQLMTTQPDRESTLSLGRIQLPQWLTPKKVILYVLWGICLLNGLLNMRSFLRPEAFGQTYEGLDQRNPAQVMEFREPVQFLQENGYDLGYGPHWNANVLTEMTDGQLPMVAIRRTEATDAATFGITYVDWLTLRSNRELPTEKPFLMLLHENAAWIQGTVFEPLVAEAYRNDQYVIFDIVDHAAFREALQQRYGL